MTGILTGKVTFWRVLKTEVVYTFFGPMETGVLNIATPVRGEPFNSNSVEKLDIVDCSVVKTNLYLKHYIHFLRCLVPSVVVQGKVKFKQLLKDKE